MLPFDKALKIVLNEASTLSSETVSIEDSLNRILSEDIKSDIDLPPCDRAIMDGYACRREDIDKELSIVEIIQAGKKPEKEIEPNQCAKIMTGASMPKGADCVIMVEHTENPTGKTVRIFGNNTNDFIRYEGEDIHAGQVVLNKGILIKPQHIAVLASAGCTKVPVAKQPIVGIIATGDELVEPDTKPNPWQLRNSNSLQLKAQLENIGTNVIYYGIAKDSIDEIDIAFKKAADECDVVTISGGVSMGDFDFGPEIFKKNNVKLLFEKIALKPGKPTVFGVREGLYCFGIPGNPVSTFTVTKLLIKPFLYKLMGHEYCPLNIKLPLGETIKRKDIERLGWFPVRITSEGNVKSIDYHGSAHINALSCADGLISMDIGIAELSKDSIVPVRLI
ncbi:MAG: molybdopterin molybdotransferase MoeA [Sedimentisphaerales bacterium]|nr:molybdopterin molybdotransferase MoeA [Sedimentisphaerales bacterium]